MLAIVLFVGQRVMRPLFDLVARQKSSELFVLFVLLVTLGLAWVTELAGLSLALGAFLAGMLISETEYRYQVEDYIKPFRDVLLGLFFVTIGMLLDVGALLRHFVAVVGALRCCCWSVKFARDLRARARLRQREARRRCARRCRSRPRASSASCCWRSRSARRARSDADTLQVVLAATLLSMLAAPLILARMERIVLHFVESEWTQRAVALHSLAVKAMAHEGRT